MIIRKELDYENTFIRGDVIDFEKGYSKHGTFLEINNRIIECGYIEENTLNGTTFKFVAMEEEVEESDKLFKLKDLLSCKPRLYCLMTTEQKRELEEAKIKRLEGKFDEALQLHIDYCNNNTGRIEGEVYEELSRLMTATGYYDLGLCFLSLANLSEIQVYSDDTLLKNNKDNFDKLKKVVEYQYKQNKSEKLAKEEEEERERLRGLVKELVGENAKYGGRLKKIYCFNSTDITLERKIYEGRELVVMKYVRNEDFIYLTNKLFKKIEDETVMLDGVVIEKEKSMHKTFFKKIVEREKCV